MRVIECEQGSEAWHNARLGRVTASRIADVIAKTKSGYAASRKNYMAELVAERLTGTTAERFVNDAMRWGTEKEPDARAAYSFITDIPVEQVGFVLHPTIDGAGASPDGLAGPDGLVELKCPNTATHIETLLTGQIPDKYIVQMQWQMACCERTFCDFVSFDPRMPGEMQIFIKRLERDDERIKEIEEGVASFLFELDQTVSKLTARFGAEAA